MALPEEVLVPPPKVQGPFLDTSFVDAPPPPTTTIPPSESEPEQVTTAAVELTFGAEQLAEGERWNQERIERRLRGEYERAGRMLTELVQDNLDSPFRLNAIRVVGARATRPSFLATLLSPYLPNLPPPSYLSSEPPPPSPQTLRSLLNTTRNVSGLLSAFDIFSEVDASLEKSPSVLSEDEDVDIVLRVKEAPRLYMKAATELGDGEGSANGTARIRNAFGGAELLEANVSFGTKTKSAFQLRLDTPVAGSPITRADLSLFASERDLSHYASCSDTSRGVQARIRTSSKYGYHELTYDAIARTMGHIRPTASLAIRESAGRTVKSAIAHTFVRDTRNDPFLPTQGSHLKLRQEYAGLGGDVNFAKLEGEYSFAQALAPGYNLSLGFKSGALFPLGGQTSHFLDRFQLGGPTSVRMFRPNSMGPRDSQDFLGGDLHWAMGVSLITPIYKKPEWPLKGHFFCNAGKLTGMGSVSNFGSALQNLATQPSVTVGLGLMYQLSSVRVEANIGAPLAMGKNEGAVKGLQFGLGLSYL